jgi:3-isopropylmalate dehydratase small subunit
MRLDMLIRRNIWKFGNDVDTDAIIAARYLNTSDTEELDRHCMGGDADSDFARKVKSGDIVLAGKNFGCGSSRELLSASVWSPMCVTSVRRRVDS